MYLCTSSFVKGGVGRHTNSPSRPPATAVAQSQQIRMLFQLCAGQAGRRTHQSKATFWIPFRVLVKYFSPNITLNIRLLNKIFRMSPRVLFYFSSIEQAHSSQYPWGLLVPAVACLSSSPVLLLHARVFSRSCLLPLLLLLLLLLPLVLLLPVCVTPSTLSVHQPDILVRFLFPLDRPPVPASLLPFDAR